MKRIEELESLDALLKQQPDLRDCVLQSLDCREVDLSACELDGTVFLGCRFSDGQDLAALMESGALIFPTLPNLPYNPYRNSLYTWQELQTGENEHPDGSLDLQIYDHMLVHRDPARSKITESLMQRIHDHAIDDALAELIAGRNVVGIMGGHSALRTDPAFRQVVELARALTRAGYFVASGGGPGIMEAANLGAWLARYDEDAIDKSIELLSRAPSYTDNGYMDAAREVLDCYPEGAESLAVPTWFYGHEPSNLFSPHIAKYFANSIREDGLLAIAIHGVVYAPGSAGTLQEVFLDLCQNHYATFKYQSPMVFLGQTMWNETIPVMPLLHRFAEGRDYAKMITCLDDPQDVAQFIIDHPPKG